MPQTSGRAWDLTDFAELILDDGEFEAVVRRQNVIQQGRFPRAEKSRDDGHRNLFVLDGHNCWSWTTF